MIIPTTHTQTSSMRFSRTQQFLDVLNDIAIIFPVFLIIFTWRGFIQALIARLMGDKTAQQDGFLTLNPLAHVDLYGILIIMALFFVIGGFLGDTLPRAILLIILLIFGVRWTHPVPIDESQFRHYRLGGILTSLAGAISNFLLAFISIGLLKLCLQANFPTYAIITLLKIFQTLIDICLFFCVLDLIPLPPFDGGKVLRYALPLSAQPMLDWLEEYSLFIFVFLFIVPGISDIFFGGLLGIAFSIKRMMFAVFF
jgi:Zn-dependent protease